MLLSLSPGDSKSGALIKDKAPLLLLMLKSSSSAPPVMLYAIGSLSASVALTVTTAVVFSVSDTVLAEVNTGSVSFRFVTVMVRLLSSKAFLLWLTGGWLMFYIVSAIWLEEAFAGFVRNLAENNSMKIPFVLFLISGYMNLFRALREKVREGKIRPVVWAVLPFGVMIFLSGFFLSISTRQSQWLLVGDGHEISPVWSNESYLVR